MGLKDLRIPEEVIKTRSGDFTVRGLDVDSLSLLIRQHGKDMTEIFNKFSDEEAEITPERVMAFALPLIEAFPQLVAQLVACAADDPSPEAVATFRRLPISVQADALEQVIVLTFDAEGGPKKFAETVVRLLQGTNGLLTSLKA